MAGFGLSLVAFVALGFTIGVTDVAQIMLQYLSLLLAGFIGGRLSGSDRILHGAVAALLLFLLAAGISLAALDPAPGTLSLLAFGAVAALLGSAGGALAQWRSIE